MFSVHAAFLSDLHLGSRWCRTRDLAAFLRVLQCQVLYLVGDTVDHWALQRRFRWTPAESEIIALLLDLARRCDVILIPGNHDRFLDVYSGADLGRVQVRTDAVHTGLDGRQYLVLHGDEVDAPLASMPVTSRIGDYVYTGLLWANRGINAGLRAAGLPGIRLSRTAKRVAKTLTNYPGHFQRRVDELARQKNLDGAICGHVHKAACKTLRSGRFYGNCGDWVEGCTALVEHLDGRWESLDWERECRKNGECR
jgi:UDP-2,3-diacylglucosamine pyrophosphatase LpxH